MQKPLDKRTSENRSFSHLTSSSDYKRPICERLAVSVKADPLQIIDDAIEEALNDPSIQEPFSRDDYLEYVLGGRERFNQKTHLHPKQ